MFSKLAKLGVVILLCTGLAACNKPKQSEILAKAKGANTPEALIAALGDPDKRYPEGALTLWRYEADGGDVCYSVVGKVALRMSC